MSIKVTSSKQESVVEAVAEIKGSLKDSGAKMVVFFASSKYDPASISSKMAAAFPDANVIGCSTSGEIISGAMQKESVVAMTLSADIVEDAKVEVVQKLKGGVNASKAVESLRETLWN